MSKLKLKKSIKILILQTTLLCIALISAILCALHLGGKFIQIGIPVFCIIGIVGANLIGYTYSKKAY